MPQPPYNPAHASTLTCSIWVRGNTIYPFPCGFANNPWIEVFCHTPDARVSILSLRPYDICFTVLGNKEEVFITFIATGYQNKE